MFVFGLALFFFSIYSVTQSLPLTNVGTLLGYFFLLTVLLNPIFLLKKKYIINFFFFFLLLGSVF